MFIDQSSSHNTECGIYIQTFPEIDNANMKGTSWTFK